MRFPATDWLPTNDGWLDAFKQLTASGRPSLDELQKLANVSLDFLKVNRLGNYLVRAYDAPPAELSARPVRLAMLGSSTLDYLLPAIRVAGLRRRAWIDTFAGEYDLYRKEIEEPAPALRDFAPDTILLSLHAEAVLGRVANVSLPLADAEAVLDQALEDLRRLWASARANLDAHIIQQTFLPTALPLVGSNEQRLPGSLYRQTERLNERLRELAQQEGVDLLAVDTAMIEDGLSAWHDPALWHRAKQQFSPAAAPMYGDLVGRIIGARLGRSAKCLVLDLDNTMWGGVIGDDGLEGIILGEGSADGEAFVAFQRYAKALSQRGVILAVCSKNDEANAWAPFDQHPEMLLKRGDIACLVANWGDKATNIRQIASDLNIGLDSLVFADDNPFERNIVRQELPMVAVPELPEDPALYPHMLARAGYFDVVAVTEDDTKRAGQYQDNLKRRELLSATTDLPSYLRSLAMKLIWSGFSKIGIKRVAQLINKSNQFNLTTLRLTEEEVTALAARDDVVTLQLRLVDKLGDNGIIGVVVAEPEADEADALAITVWLMSCRVLGRQVEEATLNLLVEQARQRGIRELIGTYIPTAKNGMVREHYARLGFLPYGEAGADGTARWRLAVADYQPLTTEIELEEE